MKSLLKIYLLAGLLVSILLTACRVSKDVKVTDTPVPVTYNNGTADTTTIASIPWETFFTEPELKSLIEAAIAHNNDLLLATKNIEASEALFRQSKWGNVPAVNLQAAAVANRPSDNSLNGFTLNQFLSTSHIEDYTIAASLSWEADLWGKIRNKQAAALATYLQTAEARKVVQTRVISDVARGYYNLLMLEAQLSVAQNNLALNDSTVQMVRLQYEYGKVTNLALQQATAQKLVAAELIPQFEEQIVLQKNALSLLTGTYPHDIAHNLQLAGLTIQEDLAAGVPATLLNRRPDVKAAELAVNEANARVGIATAEMYPSLVITAQGGLNSFKASNWFNIPASLFGTVAGGLTAPVLQRRQIKTQIETAKINREQSVIQFRRTVLNAVTEVSDKLVTIEKLRVRSGIAAERTGTLRQATDHAQQLFANGLATYLEVITAESNVLQSELALAAVKKARLDANVDLYRAVGGGW